jgi:acyl-CoA synthetase (AMP-forming)/AMP-acid ligase II
VLRADASADAADIERFCLGELARFKVPRSYVFVDSLPRNAMGKVQHFRLKEIAGGEGTQRAGEPGREARPSLWQRLVGG